MKATRNKTDRSGLTVFEVLMVVMILAVIAGLLLPMLAKSKPYPAITRCRNDLKSLGLSFRIYANDHSDLYPMQVPEAEGGALEAAANGELGRIFQVMSDELSAPQYVVCRSDQRISATDWTTLQSSNISYFVGLDAEDTRPNMILSGDRDIAESGQLLRGTAYLTTNRPVAWHKLLHKEGGNIAFADGSVQQTTTATLRELLAHSGDATNRMLFPQ